MLSMCMHDLSRSAILHSFFSGPQSVGCSPWLTSIFDQEQADCLLHHAVIHAEHSPRYRYSHAGLLGLLCHPQMFFSQDLTLSGDATTGVLDQAQAHCWLHHHAVNSALHSPK